jgi:hypothetical protein
MRLIVKLSKIVYGGLLAGSLALLAGCGKSSTAPYVPDPAIKDFPSMGDALANAPETKINAMKTPQQKAAYLQELANDTKFDPKQHKDMLEKFSKDPDADVAAAAKALLEKAS